MPDTQQYVVTVHSTREMAYAKLRNEIISMELVPGTVISTQDIATRFNISRTPVREAFIKLQAEHLLEISPQKATVVTHIDCNRVHQECFIREALEVSNMRSLVGMASEQTIQAMKQNIISQTEALQAEDYARYLETDNRFHQLEFSDTNMDLAASLIRQMNGHYDRVRLIDVRERASTTRIIKEHNALVNYIEQGNTEQAVQLLENHIHVLRNLLTELTIKCPNYFVSNELDKT